MSEHRINLCEATGKDRIRTAEEARGKLAYLAKMRVLGKTKNLAKRFYKCEHCNDYHLTSQLKRNRIKR